jgi:hydrogenase maturation protein HypF
MSKLQAGRIHITGIVQGVGFRPFVYSLAVRLGLNGWVRNTSAGVDIEVEGEQAVLENFVDALRAEAPPLSVIEELTFEPLPVNGFTSFEIVHSQPVEGAFQPISPDICICTDCLREMRTPSDRRYLYPFINCTNCGPRFTIITDIPYDRPNTSMTSFELCPDCLKEYTNPLDRRFHAQPVACPVCGPKVWIEPQRESGENPILEVQRLLVEGKIVAIKGLGGFHLACDAANPKAVSLLRKRKLRVDKPFALMMPDLESVVEHCFIEQGERILLQSRERPVVILKRRPGSHIASQVAPRQDTIGVMLPYTPLHYLLFEQFGESEIRPVNVLVMTSGNLSEEPIAIENDEARSRLPGLADAFLMHDRPIRTRCDDSVIKLVELPKRAARDTEAGKPQEALQYYRRSRGYAPAPISLPWKAPVVLAAGAELKNTFCFTRERSAFISHHIGDMENYETLQYYQDGIEHFERLFRLKPQAIAYDLHPDYLATRYALARADRDGLPAAGIQHHHAHIAACMADNNLPPERAVIGVSFDGTGYGTDGAIWGGEFLLASYAASPEHGLDQSGFRRMAHLSYMPLPGGDSAIRTPAKTALAYLWQSGIAWDEDLPSMQVFCEEERTVLRSQLEHRLNTPLTSSMGRLFDAAAALAGVRQKVNYEAQAAIEFEALADPEETDSYSFGIGEPSRESTCLTINPAPALEGLVKDLFGGTPLPVISARFHNGCARLVLEVCRKIRNETGLKETALSGGVWQNSVLLKKTVLLLEKNGFPVYLHRRVPTNDGGLALGQAVIAARRLFNQEK